MLLLRHEHIAKKYMAENRSLASHTIEEMSTTKSGVLRGLWQFPSAALSEENASFASFLAESQDSRVRNVTLGTEPSHLVAAF